VCGLLKIDLLPELVVLELVHKADASMVECFWIASLRAAGAKLLNHTDGGEKGSTRRGFKLTAATKAKISASHQGLTKDKIIERRAAKLQPSTRAPYKGQPDHLSPETRQRVTARVRERALLLRSTPLFKHPIHVAESEHATDTGYNKGCRCDICLNKRLIYNIQRRPSRTHTVWFTAAAEAWLLLCNNSRARPDQLMEAVHIHIVHVATAEKVAGASKEVLEEALYKLARQSQNRSPACKACLTNLRARIRRASQQINGSAR
jgi:hypothetical protein